MAMVGLAAAYHHRKDWRQALPIGYGLALAYIALRQAHVWSHEPDWRTYVALASSAVGWVAVWRLWADDRRT